MMIAKPKRTSKPSRPSRDEFELEELANLLVEANQGGYNEGKVKFIDILKVESAPQ